MENSERKDELFGMDVVQLAEFESQFHKRVKV